MNLAGYILLAQEEPLEGFGRILVIVVFLVIAAVFSLVRKIKEKMEQEQARRQREQRGQQLPAQRQQAAQRQQPAPPPRRTPAQEAAAVLRELFGEQAESAEVAAPPVAPPAPPQVRRRPARRPKPSPAAPSRPTALETEAQAPGQRALAERGADQAQADSRRAQLARFRSGLAGLQVDLSQPQAARSAIVLMEIIGPPRAMRGYSDPWQL